MHATAASSSYSRLLIIRTPVIQFTAASFRIGIPLCQVFYNTWTLTAYFMQQEDVTLAIKIKFCVETLESDCWL